MLEIEDTNCHTGGTLEDVHLLNDWNTVQLGYLTFRNVFQLGFPDVPTQNVIRLAVDTSRNVRRSGFRARVHGNDRADQPHPRLQFGGALGCNQAVHLQSAECDGCMGQARTHHTMLYFNAPISPCLSSQSM